MDETDPYFESGEEGANVVYLNPWSFCNDLILEVVECCSRELTEDLNSLCGLGVLCVSVVNALARLFTTEARDHSDCTEN